MELEQRVEVLEHEVKMLKNDIHKTLVDIQATLPQKPAASIHWQKKAWVLALLNMLVAVTLFTNIYMYLPGGISSTVNPVLIPWLRALWIAAAFMWLILQMYPLALLLEQEDQQWQGVVWRNAIGFFSAHPGFSLGLTAAILGVAVVNAIFPQVWFVFGLMLLIAVAGVVVYRLVELYRKQTRAHTRG
jgi:hypothetical protein